TVADEDKEGRLAPHSLAHLAELDMGSRDYAAAAERFDKAAGAAADPETRGEARFQRGLALLAGQEYAEAGKALDALVREQPGDHRAGGGLGTGALRDARPGGDRNGQGAAGGSRQAAHDDSGETGRFRGGRGAAGGAVRAGDVPPGAVRVQDGPAPRGRGAAG